MSMRQQLVQTVETAMSVDKRITLLLGDIGVFGFRNAFNNFPERTYNIGILEQATVSMAAGLATIGYIPVVHTIASFLIARSLEQIKIDFCYQKLCGNFISVGASYDYSALGCTHHCPDDIALLKTIPGINVMVPGSDKDFDELFRTIYSGPNANYFRLAEIGHSLEIPVIFGRGEKIRDGKEGIVVAIGPMLERVIHACINIDVTILYYTTLAPFDSELLFAATKKEKVAIIEPFYEGTMAYDVISALRGKSIELLSIGVPRKFLTNYGLVSEQDILCGLDVLGIKSKLESFFNVKS
jgi:transketolase